jgi:hypothetical protein
MPHSGKKPWLRRYDWDAIAGIAAAAAALILHLLHIVQSDIMLTLTLVLVALLLLRQLTHEEREERVEDTAGRTEQMIGVADALTSDRSDHRQQHLESRPRRDRVWLIRWHQHNVSRRHRQRHARDRDEGFSLQHVRDGVERRDVLTERLVFVEREQRHGPAAALEQDATDHRSFLVGSQRQRRKRGRARHFRWIRHAFLPEPANGPC